MNPASGGPCQGIRNIIPELKKSDIHNEVVCLDDPSAQFIGKDVFTVHPLGPGKGPWQYSQQLIPWLIENLDRFEIVIIHGLWLYHGYAFKKALHIYKKLLTRSGKQFKYPRFYVMPHGMLDPYFQETSSRKLKALRNNIYWKLIEGKLVNDADGVLFTCEEELLLARKPFLPYHPKREINIGYGIENPPFFENVMAKAFLQKCPQVKNEPYILFLSRVNEKKGILNLIIAYGKLLAKNNLDKIPAKYFPKLVIAGPGLDTAYGRKMLHLVEKSSNLNQFIFFTDMLTGAAKWGAFYGCDAFILPSHQENFGIAVVEALACGKPVLISNKVNIWREISNDGAGVVADDTIDGTEKILLCWLRLSDSERKIMGEQASKSYREHFSIQLAAERFRLLVNL